MMPPYFTIFETYTFFVCLNETCGNFIKLSFGTAISKNSFDMHDQMSLEYVDGIPCRVVRSPH